MRLLLAAILGALALPAAAQTPELDVIARRMLKTTRLTAIVLLPLLPPILVLAPVLLPGVLGSEWKAMVVPFQILVAVGIGHALLVALGDSMGEARERAYRNAERIHFEGVTYRRDLASREVEAPVLP